MSERPDREPTSAECAAGEPAAASAEPQGTSTPPPAAEEAALAAAEGAGSGRDPRELAAVIEAILAVAGDPVPADALAAAAGEGVTREEAEAALALLAERHAQPGSGLVVERVGGGWRLATRPEHEAAVRAFLGLRSRARLSQAALETLAIVAYRQPVTLPEINFLRGVNSAGVVRTLLERKLVRVAGRKAVVGTPLLYRTSKEFLVRFGLESLAALPAIEQVVQETGEPTSAAAGEATSAG